MVVHRRVTPSIKIDSTHKDTWVERVKCLVQEHNTMSPARARTWTAQSGVDALIVRPLRLTIIFLAIKGRTALSVYKNSFYFFLIVFIDFQTCISNDIYKQI